MLSQTIDQLLPFLQLIQQPAFCIRQEGDVVHNHAAAALAPASADMLPHWLGSSAEAYDAWDRSGSLTLSVTLAKQTCSAVIRPLRDGTLFLLSQQETLPADANVLAVTAQVLRQPLTDLASLVQDFSEEMEEMEDPFIQQRTAAITRQIYRLTRLSCNLSDLERMRSGACTLHLEKVDLTAFLFDLTMELTDLCQSAGYQLKCQLPEKTLFVHADTMLLQRGILNLLANAMKYGRKDSPIEFRVDTTAGAVLLRMRNRCSQTDTDLLTAAFRRMKQRGVLPDPQWGLGLGLPMARSIAQLMGGTVAVEVKDDTAAVTMSISRKKTLLDNQVKAPPAYDYTGGMHPSYVELSDCLPDFCFDSVVL